MCLLELYVFGWPYPAAAAARRPRGWSKFMHAEHNQPFWMEVDDSGNCVQGTARWLPPSWTEHTDPASGNHFYRNEASGETSWTVPTEA